MSGDLGRDVGSGIGAVIGVAIARPLVRARLRRLGREASGRLDEGEKLVAPVGVGSRGGRTPLVLGLGVWAITLIVMLFIADHIGSLADVVVLGGYGAGLLLGLLAWFVSETYAVALTDRRLLAFRMGGIFRRHIRDLVIATPRTEVSTTFNRRGGGLWSVLGVELAPPTDRTPIQVDFVGVNTQIAEAIHLAAGRSIGAQHAPSLATTAVEGPAWEGQIPQRATQPAPTPGPWEKRRPRWPWIAVALGAALVAVAIFALNDDDGGRSASETTGTTTPKPLASPVEEPAVDVTPPAVLTLGDSATVSSDADTGVITVKSMRITTRPHDRLIGSTPENGYFLIFTAALKTDAHLFVFEDDFYVQTANGKRLDEGNGTSWDAVDPDDLLGAVELNSGEHKTALLVFDSPVKHGILAYAPMEGGPIASWKF